MRHLKKGRKFGRVRNQRMALKKSMASSFFVSGRMQTTEAKARELRPALERILTRAKAPTLSNRRYFKTMFSDVVVGKLLAMASSLGTRPGGYTRITKVGVRRRDSARLAILELVQ